MTEHPAWQTPLAECIDQQESTGGFLALLPEYRPDLAHSMACRFNLRFYDYRQEEMAPLGWEAGSLTLEDLDQSLRQQVEHEGIIAFNIEALLATKPEDQRRQWLAGFIAIPWAHAILLPLTVFPGDAPENPARVCNLQSVRLPEQSLVNRLAM